MTLLHIGVTFVAFNWQHSPFQKYRNMCYQHTCMSLFIPLSVSLSLSLSLTYTQLSFDDIAKYGGVYGEKHSALSTLQSQLQSSQSTLWTGMQGHPATLLTSSLTFNYDLDPEDVLGTIQNLMPSGHFPCVLWYCTLFGLWNCTVHYNVIMLVSMHHLKIQGCLSQNSLRCY